MNNNLSNQVVEPETVGIASTAADNGDGKTKRKRMSKQEQIDYYKKKQAEYANKIKDAERDLKERDRKQRTRDLIAIGGVVRKYVPDATTDSTATLIQRALASQGDTDADIVAIGNAARAVMPTITADQMHDLIKTYTTLFPAPQDVRIDRDVLKAIYNQRKYLTDRLSTSGNGNVSANQSQ